LVNGKFPSNIMTTQEGVLDTNVFLVKKPTKVEKDVSNTHLSVKPIELIQHLIQLFTREGALVLDPFMGSGTTAVAAKSMKRHYIGFEINQEYLDICTIRLR
jgi:site-specific DNA-methyltransferase (adenine-specific)